MERVVTDPVVRGQITEIKEQIKHFAERQVAIRKILRHDWRLAPPGTKLYQLQREERSNAEFITGLLITSHKLRKTGKEAAHMSRAATGSASAA